MKWYTRISNWILSQYEWAKSFFEEIYANGTKKASQKRLVGFLTVCTFLYSYLFVLLKKTEAIAKISDIQLPDIPPMWATLIGFIIGVNLLGTVNKNSAMAKNVEKKVEENDPK